MNGQCVNTTIQQHVTFGTQGLPFGINLGNGKKNAGNRIVATLPQVLGAVLTATCVAAILGMGLI